MTPILQAEETGQRVARALKTLREGGLVLLYDADGREEETDLVVASEYVSPATIRYFRSLAGGLICTTLHPRFHQALALPYLSDLLASLGADHPLLARLSEAPVPYESTGSKPSFTISINHRDTYTGITDNDRALTISRLAALLHRAGRVPSAELRERFAQEFKSPGHVFLLNAREGLLETRRGHTELSTALLGLAGLTPTATICEMMNGPSGRALPKTAAMAFAKAHKVPFLTGADVVAAWRQGRPPSAPPMVGIAGEGFV